MFGKKKETTQLEELDEEIIDEIEEEDDESLDEDTVIADTSTVCCKVKSLSELARFANKRGNGTMQFMTKNTLEVFELRDSHFRIAQVWGTVTMVRECTADEYARVMLAIELRDHPENYYMLPGLTETEIKSAIEEFCEDRFSVNGKKYSKKPERFTKLLKDSDMREEWDEYTCALVYDKLEAFCEEKGIVFESVSDESEEETVEDGADS